MSQSGEKNGYAAWLENEYKSKPTDEVVHNSTKVDTPQDTTKVPVTVQPGTSVQNDSSSNDEMSDYERWVARSADPEKSAPFSTAADRILNTMFVRMYYGKSLTLKDLEALAPINTLESDEYFLSTLGVNSQRTNGEERTASTPDGIQEEAKRILNETSNKFATIEAVQKVLETPLEKLVAIIDPEIRLKVVKGKMVTETSEEVVNRLSNTIRRLLIVGELYNMGAHLDDATSIDFRKHRDKVGTLRFLILRKLFSPNNPRFERSVQALNKAGVLGEFSGIKNDVADDTIPEIISSMEKAGHFNMGSTDTIKGIEFLEETFTKMQSLGIDPERHKDRIAELISKKLAQPLQVEIRVKSNYDNANVEVVKAVALVKELNEKLDENGLKTEETTDSLRKALPTLLKTFSNTINHKGKISYNYYNQTPMVAIKECSEALSIMPAFFEGVIPKDQAEIFLTPLRQLKHVKQEISREVATEISGYILMVQRLIKPNEVQGFISATAEILKEIESANTVSPDSAAVFANTMEFATA